MGAVDSKMIKHEEARPPSPTMDLCDPRSPLEHRTPIKALDLTHVRVGELVLDAELVSPQSDGSDTEMVDDDEFVVVGGRAAPAAVVRDSAPAAAAAAAATAAAKPLLAVDKENHVPLHNNHNSHHNNIQGLHVPHKKSRGGRRGPRPNRRGGRHIHSSATVF